MDFRPRAESTMITVLVVDGETFELDTFNRDALIILGMIGGVVATELFAQVFEVGEHGKPRLAREFEAAGRLKHPNLVAAFEAAGVKLLLLQCSPQLEEMERFADLVIRL